MMRQTFKRYFLPCLIAGAILLVGVRSVQAQVIIELPPPPSNASNVTPAQFNAIEFSLSAGFSNVEIEASLVTEETAGSTGTAYLTTAIGPGTTAADLIAGTDFAFTVVGDVSTDLSYVSLFTGLSLSADDYFLVLGEPITGAGGGISFNSSATYVTDPNASVGNMFFSTTEDPTFPPASTFVTSGLGNRYFRVTAVPEPACMALVCIAGFAVLRRRRA